MQLMETRRRYFAVSKVSSHSKLSISILYLSIESHLLDGKKGEWISLDLTRCLFFDEIQFVLEVDEAMETVLQKSVCEVSADGLDWVSHASNILLPNSHFCNFFTLKTKSKQQMSCTVRADSDATTSLRCISVGSQIYVRYIRLRLLENVASLWKISEMYVIHA